MPLENEFADLPVLLITGYNDPRAESAEAEDWIWLMKPFRQAELAEQIRRVMAAARATAEPIAQFAMRPIA